MISFRVDRVGTLWVAAPLLRATRNGVRIGLPILMYHSISNDLENGVGEYYKTNTSPEAFRRQMRFLKDAGYRVVTLEEAVRALRAGDQGREKQVVVTFDDGFRNFYDQAYPVLSDCGFTATMFLPTAFIGNSRHSFKGRECLTWPEVRELHDAGIEFGSHTINHPVLVDLEWKEIEHEIRDSKNELEQNIAARALTFAYPYAFPQADRAFARRFERLLVEAGYICCVSTAIGVARAGDDLFQLKRLPVNSGDDNALLQAKLEGAYNWLAVPQLLSKRGKHLLRWTSSIRQIAARNGRGLDPTTTHDSPETMPNQSVAEENSIPSRHLDRSLDSQADPPGRYVVITPVRDEAEHLGDTINSMAAQTLKPLCWVIVDDGSSDQTGQIADEAQARYPWIQAVHRGDRGFRKSGGGVIEAFYEGFRRLNVADWEYLVKFDGDLSFDPDYFKACLGEFVRNPRLGIGGGTICGRVDGELVEESKGDPRFHVRGATKIYRRVCWEALGGLVRLPGWDTIDEVKANMLGWETYTFANLKLAHHRHAGDADGAWKNWVKNGLANFNTGYHPVFMLVKCCRRLAWGFVSSYLRGAKRGVEPEVVQYLHREQMNRLLFKKSLWK
jgi:biofilm PGA synthesis N-glycosyltransferase PgaC